MPFFLSVLPLVGALLLIVIILVLAFSPPSVCVRDASSDEPADTDEPEPVDPLVGEPLSEPTATITVPARGGTLRLHVNRETALLFIRHGLQPFRNLVRCRRGMGGRCLVGLDDGPPQVLDLNVWYWWIFGDGYGRNAVFETAYDTWAGGPSVIGDDEVILIPGDFIDTWDGSDPKHVAEISFAGIVEEVFSSPEK
ncbi:hypothetical protein AMJ57_02470 [Parcubacteria bacterium SG8_24]|nr:MAG: hypothetical protein AMJ57_02470 [Parcubacteria bacterium SG8_24]